MKWLLFCSTFIMYLANISLAQQIVKDVNGMIAGIKIYISIRISKMVNLVTKTYVVANDASNSNEPWIIDRTAADTYFAKSTNKNS